jgi:hypothetical protein
MVRHRKSEVTETYRLKCDEYMAKSAQIMCKYGKEGVS